MFSDQWGKIYNTGLYNIGSNSKKNVYKTIQFCFSFHKQLSIFRGFPGSSDGKESACGAGDPCSAPWLEKSLGEGNGNQLQYSCLENPMDEGAWQVTVHGVAKSWTRLSDFTFTSPLEKETATNSSILAWRIPGTEEPGGLPSMGSQRVGHGWNDLAAAAVGAWSNCYLGFIILFFHYWINSDFWN